MWIHRCSRFFWQLFVWPLPLSSCYCKPTISLNCGKYTVTKITKPERFRPFRFVRFSFSRSSLSEPFLSSGFLVLPVPHVWSNRKMAAHMARKALYVYGAFCILLFAKASYECESKYLHFLPWLKTELWVILKMEFEKRVKTILKFAPRPRASTRLSRVTCTIIVPWLHEKQI